MTFLPAENITYTTTLKKDDLLSRLAEYVEPVKSNSFFNFFATNTSMPYKGKIVGLGSMSAESYNMFLLICCGLIGFACVIRPVQATSHQ